MKFTGYYILEIEKEKKKKEQEQKGQLYIIIKNPIC